VTTAQYDLDRAAEAGGFADDLESGRECARRLHRVVQRLGFTDHAATVDAAVEDIAAAWAVDAIPEESRGGPLSALANSISAMYLDLIQQIQEARGEQA
jgi:hypothetical protein